MKRLFFLLTLGLLTLGFGAPPPALAGDEDVKEAKKAAAEPQIPADKALPKDVEAPDMSVGDSEDPTPDYQEIKPTGPGKAGAGSYVEKDPDENVDYSRLVDMVEASELSPGVLPPALGFRGYRPNMIAVGAGDRTPGFGGLVEYSWNRLGAGVFASYLNHHGEDTAAQSSGFAGAYGLYRWLPFDVSPYILMGLEVGSATDESLGGLLGLGLEARIYSGYTFLLGWTHHSTVHRGYFGGALGWSF